MGDMAFNGIMFVSRYGRIEVLSGFVEWFISGRHSICSVYDGHSTTLRSTYSQYRKIIGTFYTFLQTDKACISYFLYILPIDEICISLLGDCICLSADYMYQFTI